MTRPQEIRHECLLQLYGSGSIPVSLAHIQKVAKRGGFSYTETELRDQLHFLVTSDPALAEKIEDEATGETRYRITAKGMLAYENAN